MKKVKRVLTVVLTIVVLFACSVGSSAYEFPVDKVGYTIDEPYDYPIKPGTDEWFKIEDHVEKREMLQIPQDVLEKMTTESLVESIANYPYLLDMLAFSTQKLGYEAVRNGFNGLQELERRPDGMSCLAKYYEKNQKNLNFVVRSAIQITLDANRDEKEPQDTELTRVFLPTTPSGNTVTSSWCNYNTSPDWSEDDIEAINDDIFDTYGLTPLRQPTWKYNCHSYAWYDQSSSNLWWIAYPDDFMADDYYAENTGLICSGNKAVYRLNATSTEYLHSAIVVHVGSGSGPNPPITVISKWGPLGLYSHTLYNCPPEYGRNMLFYKVA